jgi:hypothetical protein
MSDRSEPKDSGSTKPRSGSQTRQQTRQVNVGLLPGEYEELERAAAAAGLSKAAFLRQCWKGHAGERARRSPTVDRQALAAVRANLARVGNNLNQLARAANMNQIPDLPELSATLADVRLAASESLKALGYRPHDSQG